MTDDTVELKPCPFCGGDYQTWSHVRDGRSLGCSKCGARFTQYNGRDIIEERLAALWNTRSAMPQQEVTVKDAAKVLLASCPNPIFDNLKYDLIGEFSQTECYVNDDGDEDSMIVTVEWWTIKEIITAALSALSGQDAEGET